MKNVSLGIYFRDHGALNYISFEARFLIFQKIVQINLKLSLLKGYCCNYTIPGAKNGPEVSK